MQLCAHDERVGMGVARVVGIAYWYEGALMLALTAVP